MPRMHYEEFTISSLAGSSIVSKSSWLHVSDDLNEREVADIAPQIEFNFSLSEPFFGQAALQGNTD